MTTCPCGAGWHGLSIAHCTTCHRTFTTVGNFDRHRVRHPDDKTLRVCADPPCVGLVQNDRGQWSQPGREVAA